MHTLPSAQRLLEHYPAFFASDRLTVQVASLLVDDTYGLSTPYVHFKMWRENHVVGAVNLRLTKNREIVKFYGHLGFEVIEKYRGKGLAREACELIIPYIFALGFRRIVITCHPGNIASRLTIEKLGARFIMYRDFPTDTETHDNERLIYCWDLPRSL